MAAATFSITPDNTSDATWRAWGVALHNAINGLGVLVQTSDTGQINWTTATKAGGGYEMWSFNDALQATAPVYIKVSFSSGPAITFLIGTATNGAGGLIGTTLTSVGFNGGSSTAAQTGYVSATTARLTLLFPQASSDWVIIGVERPFDNTGTALGTGVLAVLGGATCWLAQGATLPASNAGGHSTRCIRNEGSNLIGTQCTTFPVNPVGTNYQVQNPMLSFLWYWSSDIGLGGTMSCTLYGTAHTYMNPSSTPNGGSYSAGMSSSLRVMVLYE